MSEHLDRLEAMAAIADTATGQRHRVHAFSPGDAQALRWALSRLREAEARDAELGRLREAVRITAAGCVVCAGTGELREAVQGWDVPGAPVPDCPHCAPARAALQEKGA